MRQHSFAQLPFYVGSQAQPGNNGLPDTLPFHVTVDADLGCVVQTGTDELKRHLASAYATGSLLGTASDDSPLGKPYTLDIEALILARRHAEEHPTVLEIGAGRGYLLHRLQHAGFQCLGIEPGAINRPSWEKYGVTVINDSFPSPRITRQFDTVVAYAVLEHIEEPQAFLRSVLTALSPDGLLILSVPDCEQAIRRGDPSIFLHEHFYYFTANSLRRLLTRCGYTAEIVPAGYGTVLHCVARKNGAQADVPPPPEQEIADLEQSLLAMVRSREMIAERLDATIGSGRSVGLYCAPRALSLVPPGAQVRLFDDDTELQGRFLPGFASAIESRRQLMDRPTDELWVLSPTFGTVLTNKLRAAPELRNSRILNIDELLMRETRRI
jgi:SAM-dependent methyltransferase